MQPRTPCRALRRSAALTLSLLPFATPLVAQKTSWSHPDGTTHWYEAVAVPGGVTWDEANHAANAAGGYLATLTSAQEALVVYSMVGGEGKFWSQGDGPWIGGLQPVGSKEPLDGWRWAELEPFSYQNWASNQPDDTSGADRIHLGGEAAPAWTWADSPASRRLPGFIVERSGPTVPRTAGLLDSKAGVTEGYTLFAPTASRDTYLIDLRGRLIHSWVGSAPPGMSAYLLPDGNLLRASRAGNTTFTVGGVGGLIEEFDWSGKLVWTYRYSSSLACQHHDVARLPNGNTLLIAWELKTSAEAIAAGRNPSLLTNGVLYPDAIIEVEKTGPDSGRIVWEWHVWDHLIQDFDPSKANYGNVAAHPELVDVNYPPPGHLGSGIHDWMHSNSVAYNAELDQIVLSVRHFNEFWVIDHSTTTAEAAGHTGGRSGKGGDLLYRWGNPEAYRAGTPADRQLFQQHDADWIPTGSPGARNFLVFNNGVERPGAEYSSVLEIVPPTPDARGNYPRTGAAWGPAQPVWSYQDPGAFESRFVGGVQRLPSGNTLICAGWQGWSFEVTPQGNTLWSYASPVYAAGARRQGSVANGNQMFRSPRYPASYPAFAGRDLTPKGTIELHDTVLLADGSGADHDVRIGDVVSLSVRSGKDPNKLYLVGTSMTAGMIGHDFRYLRVGWDPVLEASMTGQLGFIFFNYAGSLDALGRAQASIAVPNHPLLDGVVLRSTFAVLDPNLDSGIATLANEVAIRIDA